MDTPTFNPDAATLPPRATPSDGQTLPQNLPPAAPPITIPDYELLGELGRGGMGVVYRAQQRKLKRIVALKMVLGSGCVSDDSLGRFRAEAEAVARLQHPNIVQVYEVGDSSGMPFFSLEFVDGGSLDRKLHGTPLPAKEAARLVRTLALAIQHAHDHGIIHRDLKPANVLLMSDGTPKVTDFGLAKQIDSDSGQTKSGAILGTPSYMAPEQAAGETKLIGPLADVYALGAILYECLTGRPPFRAPTPLDTVLQVINENPVAPTRLQPDTPRDLETICLKCLYKSPKRRYASAQELADDLDRFLNGDPIQARPASAWEKSRHWCKKNPKKARFVASAIVSAVIMSGFLTKSRSDALANASKSERERKATADALLVAEERKREADTAKTAAQEAEAEVKEEKNAAVARLYASSIYLAHREWDANNVFRAEQLLNDCPQDMRGWEWDFVKGLCRQDVQRLAGHFSAVDQICFGPNGISLFTSGSDGLRSWNLAAGRETAGVLPHTPFAVHPDGKWMAAGSNGQALLLNAADGQLLQSVYIGPYTINALAFSADGQSMHVSTQTGGLWRWNFTAGTAPVKSQSTPAFNYINQSGSFRPVFSHDASIIAAGSNGGSISVWDFAKGTKKFDLDGHVMHTTQTAFSPDGRWLASASGDAQIILWNLADGKEIRRFKGHGGEVRCVAFSPDGKQLATGGADKVVRIWDTTEPVYRARANVLLALKSLDMKGYRPLLSEGGQTYYGHIGPTLAFAFSDDGRFVATSGNGDPSILVWNLPDHRVQHVLPIPFRQYNRLAFSHDGNLLVTAGAVVSADSPSEIVFWNTRTGKSIRKVRGPICERTACAFSPDATTVSVAFRTGNGSEIISWDAGSGAETWRSPKLPARLGANSLAYSPDGRELVIGIDTGVAIWPVGADRSRLEIAAPMGSAGATVSRRGLIATAGNDASIRLWSTADGKPVSTLDGHVGNVQSLGFSPDGDRLISAGNEMAVKVWDVPNGRELLTFRDHRRPITQVGWSPDGSRIASCGFDGTLKVWEAHRSASASAAAWPVVFSDRFDRSELGPNWTANPKIWTIQNGMAVGKLSPFVLSSGLTFQTAILTLKAADLPTTFALKFDVRVDQPQMASSIFINPRSKQSLQPLLSGRNDRGGLAAGASLLMMSSDQMATSVGVPRAKFVFRPGRVYHVRVLREPKTIVLEVDGSEVLSERIPDFEAPALSLQGSWGDQGDIVRFSNVELRAPLTAVRAREIRSRVEERFDDLLLKSLVAEELAKDATLSDEDRQTVAKSLSDCQENIETLAAGAVSVAQEPNREPAAYRLALAQRREIVQRAPENWRYLFVLGIAHYRVGEFTPALGRIESSIELARKLDGAAEPNQWAMLALTANKLQQSERARDAYVRMRDSLADHSIADAPNSQYFAGEVTRDLGSIIAEIQLANAEKEAIKKLVWGADTAGWGEGDLARYMAQRSADYHEITARSEAPGPYDVDWDRATVEQVRRLQFRPGRVPNVKVVHEDVQVDIHGESATMSDRSIVLETNYFRATQSVCQLKRTDGRWQIVSVRHWPVSEKLGPALKAFDSSFWAARDSDVEKEQKGGVPRKIARALHEAQRDREALPIAQKYCEDAIANATDWSFRGDIAVEAGDIDDAREAFRKAMAIDPEVELPWYIRRFLWAHGTNWAQLATTILPDGRVASGGFDKVVTLLGPTGSVLGAIAGASNAVASVAGSPDGKTIVAGAFGGDNELLVIDVVEQKIRRRLTGLTGTIFRVGVSPDGSKAFSASADNTARIWNLATGQETLKLSHDDFVLGAAYSPDGSQIATASHDKTCRLWDALTGRLIATFSFKSQLKRVHFHPNGQRLAVATTDGTIAVVDLATKQVQEWKAHKGTAEVVLFSPDGRWLASAGDDGTIRIWDWTNKKKTAALAGHSAAVYALAFSADGKRLVSASSDGTIRMWDAVIEP